ncbi:hypothetical protein ACN47E_005831 [Coniothyrium glycines]
MIPIPGNPRHRAVIKYIGLAVLALLLIPIIFGLPHRSRDLSPALRILPLGDSITWGWQPEHRENGTNGYRAKLLRDLVYAQFDWRHKSWHMVDFVGTQHSGLMPDNDNEGYPGYRISQIHEAMGKALAMRPNVVLLHAGTNDLNKPARDTESWEDAPVRLGRLLDEVLRVCPDAVVMVAKIIQAEAAQTAKNIQAYNNAIPGIVQKRSRAGHKVIVVDHSIIGPAELSDGLHPTYAGYAHMGDIWYHAIKKANEKKLIRSPVSLAE